jgi:probable F420-dependent oxidoreductase
MRFFLEYPLSGTEDGGAWLEPANMLEFARAAEAAGVDAIALTDHPAPSRKWLDAGGHNTLDPFAGLAFFAAATSTLRLMTYLTVVPYRNPFLLAKAMTSVDVLSGGRATFVVGTGYLRSEFAALGAGFHDRNERFDESMEVVRGLLSSPHEFRHEGRYFTGLGVTMSPPPVQKPYPPLWLGGNATVVRQRVARWGDGWAPLTVGGKVLGKVARTAPILSDEQLAGQIREIQDEMAAAGRDPERLDVAAPGTTLVSADASAEQKIDHVATLSDLGVTWTSVPLVRSTFAGGLDGVAAFGEQVITKTRGQT